MLIKNRIFGVQASYLSFYLIIGRPDRIISRQLLPFLPCLSIILPSDMSGAVTLVAERGQHRYDRKILTYVYLGK